MYTKKDKTYLLTYIPYCGQGLCSYNYDLFYLDKNNKKVNVTSKNIWFDIYNVEDKTNFNIAALVNFYSDINSYLNKSMLLISTIDGNLEYSTEKEKLSKTEEYSFLYWEGSYLIYNQDDSIKEKLEKYRQFVINMKKEGMKSPDEE